jgi:glycosyltransferase involved in cell wall biosynthesis
MEKPSDKIRIALLGDARQVHIHRWSRYLDEMGFDVLTLSLEPVKGVSGFRRRIGVPSFLPDFVRYPLAVPQIRGVLARFRPDVVSAHFVPNYGVIAALVRRSPWVLSAWGSDVMLLPERSAFHMRRTRFVIRRADYITSDADVMSRRLVELGAAAERVITFPYGVDRKVFFPAAAAPSPAGRKGPSILCNRKLERVYNVTAVIDAFSEVKRGLPCASLTIAGSGSLRRALEERARGAGLADAVRFAGDVPHAGMADLLREHDVFVSVALSDTTSVSLLEAIACGLYPVVSDIPANREWIEDGANGAVVDPADPSAIARAIADAWANRSLREEAAQKNAGLIETRADWYKNMSVVNDLFRRLAGRMDVRVKGGSPPQRRNNGASTHP